MRPIQAIDGIAVAMVVVASVDVEVQGQELELAWRGS